VTGRRVLHGVVAMQEGKRNDISRVEREEKSGRERERKEGERRE
jgi:hypothetical protein